MKKRTLDDVLLMLATLFYQRGSLKGRTRLQKTVFLLKEKFNVPFTFEFRPYYYGPYSEDLTDLVSILKAIKILDEIPESLGLDVTRYNYQLTEKGKKYFKDFKRSAKSETIEAIDRLEGNIHEINKMNTPDLISTAKALMN